jgi:hypothetical protein
MSLMNGIPSPLRYAPPLILPKEKEETALIDDTRDETRFKITQSAPVAIPSVIPKHGFSSSLSSNEGGGKWADSFPNSTSVPDLIAEGLQRKMEKFGISESGSKDEFALQKANEDETAALVEKWVANNNVLYLEEFCRRLPKIGLHNHLSGFPGVNHYIKFALECNLYWDKNNKQFSVLGGEGRQLVSEIMRDSTQSREWISEVNTLMGINLKDKKQKEEFKEKIRSCKRGHTKFFDTWSVFGKIADHLRLLGKLVEPVVKKALDQNVLYYEMMTEFKPYPPFPPGYKEKFDIMDLEQAYALLDQGWLEKYVKTAVQLMDVFDKVVPKVVEEKYKSAHAIPGKKELKSMSEENLSGEEYNSLLKEDNLPLSSIDGQVTIRWINELNRDKALYKTFAYMCGAVRTIQKEKENGRYRLCSFNLVGREPSMESKSNFPKHVRMMQFLKEFSKTHTFDLKIAMHAGELTNAEAYESYEYQPITVLLAEKLVNRIGHGVSIASEQQGLDELFAQIREQNVYFEVCPASNREITGAKGSSHPMSVFIEEMIPWGPHEDDPGIIPTTLGKEYETVITDYKLNYKQIKNILRWAVEHSFLPGETSIYEKDEEGYLKICKPFCSVGISCWKTDPTTAAYFDKNSPRYSQKACLGLRFEIKTIELEKFYAKKNKASSPKKRTPSISPRKENSSV